jgi:hypothetical protein
MTTQETRDKRIRAPYLGIPRTSPAPERFAKIAGISAESAASVKLTTSVAALGGMRRSGNSTRLPGRPPGLIPNEAEAAWQLLTASWVYTVADADRPGPGLHTLLVDDLDRVIAGFAERGIVPDRSS